MSFTYYTGIPNAPDDPADDQPLMQTNTNSIASLIAVDHIAFNLANGGAHKVVHLKNNAGTPAAVVGFGEIYANTLNSINNDTALYYQTGGGKNIQMTVNAVPIPKDTSVANQTRGWSFLPGGIIINYGSIVLNPAQTTGSVTYLQPYQVDPPYSLTFGNAALAASSSHIIWVDNAASNTLTGFNWKVDTFNNTLVLWWMAIGR